MSVLMPNRLRPTVNANQLSNCIQLSCLELHTQVTVHLCSYCQVLVCNYNYIISCRCLVSRYQLYPVRRQVYVGRHEGLLGHGRSVVKQLYVRVNGKCLRGAAFVYVVWAWQSWDWNFQQAQSSCIRMYAADRSRLINLLWWRRETT